MFSLPTLSALHLLIASDQQRVNRKRFSAATFFLVIFCHMAFVVPSTLGCS
jgi:hypothetical protein